MIFVRLAKVGMVHVFLEANRNQNRTRDLLQFSFKCSLPGFPAIHIEADNEPPVRLQDTPSLH